MLALTEGYDEDSLVPPLFQPDDVPSRYAAAEGQQALAERDPRHRGAQPPTL